MGITISHRLTLQKMNVKGTLDRTQALAQEMKTAQADKLDIPFNIRRENDYSLLIDIGNCETLCFEFMSSEKIQKEYSYITEYFKKNAKGELYNGYEIELYPQNELYFASSFCKTQYAHSIVEHKWVAELVRSVASYCKEAYVNDEGDYYHTGDLKDATEAIDSTGKLINSIGAMLAGSGWDDMQIIKGETNIKSRKTNRN